MCVCIMHANCEVVELISAREKGHSVTVVLFLLFIIFWKIYSMCMCWIFFYLNLMKRYILGSQMIVV